MFARSAFLCLRGKRKGRRRAAAVITKIFSPARLDGEQCIQAVGRPVGRERPSVPGPAAIVHPDGGRGCDEPAADDVGVDADHHPTGRT